MAEDYLKYRQGYSIGVGGVVVRDDKVLLVRRASEPRKGDWALPGGYIEHHETVHIAVQREVYEETGIVAEVVGLIAVLHRWREDENGVYLMFLMHSESGAPQPDNVETDAACFFTLSELDDLPTLQWLSRSIVTPILEGKRTVLPFLPLPNNISVEQGVLYAADNVEILVK